MIKTKFLHFYSLLFLISNFLYGEIYESTTSKEIERINKTIYDEKMFHEKESKELFTQREKEILKKTWADIIKLEENLINEYKIPNEKIEKDELLYKTLVNYNLALNFIKFTIGKKNFETILNEEDNVYGIEKNSFDQFKNMVLKREKITEISKDYSELSKQSIWYVQISNEYKEFTNTWESMGEILLLKNRVDNISDKQKEIVFPPIKKALNIGTKRISRRKGGYITRDQAEEITESLRTGDIIIERKDWYLSNVGFPGFWGHSAIYVGDAVTLEKWSNDSSIDNYYKESYPDYESFTKYLEKKYPKAYADYIKQVDGDNNKIIEVLAPGVVWKTANGSIGNSDYVGALRPLKLSKLDIAKALEIAFSYYGRAYDYKFDFVSDNEFVCSELVLKSYIEKEGKKGINFNMHQNFNKTYLSPSLLVKDFALGTYEGILGFVLFYDGFEDLGIAKESTEEEFRKSYDRPGIHFDHKPYTAKEKDENVKPELYKKYKNIPINISILNGGDIGSIISREMKNTNWISLNLINGVSDRLRGVELGTFMNYVREDMKGIQLVLGTNAVVADGYGLQGAIYKNLAMEDFVGWQISALYNYVGNTSKGLQSAVFINKNRNNNGIMLGSVNSSGTNKGLQLGVFNKSEKNKGLQLGIVNYTSDGDQGVPVGLLSLNKTPYISLNTWISETDKYVGLETGNKRYLNQFFIKSDKDNKYSFGYEWGVKKKSSNFMYKPTIYIDFSNENLSFGTKVVLEKEIFNKLSLSGGIGVALSPKDGNLFSLSEYTKGNLKDISPFFQYGINYRF